MCVKSGQFRFEFRFGSLLAFFVSALPFNQAEPPLITMDEFEMQMEVCQCPFMCEESGCLLMSGTSLNLLWRIPIPPMSDIHLSSPCSWYCDSRANRERRGHIPYTFRVRCLWWEWFLWPGFEWFWLQLRQGWLLSMWAKNGASWYGWKKNPVPKCSTLWLVTGNRSTARADSLELGPSGRGWSVWWYVTFRSLRASSCR